MFDLPSALITSEDIIMGKSLSQVTNLEAKLIDCELNNINWDNIDLSNAILKNVIIKNAHITNSFMRKAILDNVTFENVVIENLNFRGAVINNVKFINSKINLVNLDEAAIDKLSSYKSSWHEISISKAKKIYSDFQASEVNKMFITRTEAKIIANNSKLIELELINLTVPSSIDISASTLDIVATGTINNFIGNKINGTLSMSNVGSMNLYHGNMKNINIAGTSDFIKIEDTFIQDRLEFANASIKSLIVRHVYGEKILNGLSLDIQDSMIENAAIEDVSAYRFAFLDSNIKHLILRAMQLEHLWLNNCTVDKLISSKCNFIAIWAEIAKVLIKDLIITEPGAISLNQHAVREFTVSRVAYGEKVSKNLTDLLALNSLVGLF